MAVCAQWTDGLLIDDIHMAPGSMGIPGAVWIVSQEVVLTLQVNPPPAPPLCLTRDTSHFTIPQCVFYSLQ